MNIICKPCFAFDALGAMVFCNYCRDDIPYIKEKINQYFNGFTILPSNSFFDLLVANLSFEKIEALDLKSFTEIYPEYIKENPFRNDLLRGLEVLKEMDFTCFWSENCLPVLEKQCKGYSLAMSGKATASLLSDIQKIKPNEKIDNINVYITYFTYPVSFQFTTTSYLTNYGINSEIKTKDVLRLFAHELLHRFSDDKLREIYRNTYKSDELLMKSNDVLFNKKGSPSDEEEFVVALEHYISYKNGLITKDEAYQSLFNYYESCMPVAVITFDELIKFNEIPDDVNSWIYNLFISGIIKTGEIENRVNQILPGFVDKFMDIWFKNGK